MAPGIGHSSSQRQHYLFLSTSPRFSAYLCRIYCSFFSVISCLYFIRFPIPLNTTYHGLSSPSSAPDSPPSHHLNIFVTMSSSYFQERKSDGLSLSFFFEQLSMLSSLRAFCSSAGYPHLSQLAVRPGSVGVHGINHGPGGCSFCSGSEQGSFW